MFRRAIMMGTVFASSLCADEIPLRPELLIRSEAEAFLQESARQSPLDGIFAQADGVNAFAIEFRKLVASKKYDREIENFVKDLQWGSMTLYSLIPALVDSFESRKDEAYIYYILKQLFLAETIYLKHFVKAGPLENETLEKIFKMISGSAASANDKTAYAWGKTHRTAHGLRFSLCRVNLEKLSKRMRNTWPREQ
mgnify:CR=1 FL=1